MPKITETSPQKNNPRRFNIFLDGEFSFGADEDLVVEYRLIPGKIIEQALLEKLLYEADVGKLMERMYRLFHIRQRSEKEVRDYLTSLSFKREIKGEDEISSASIELVINKLKKKRLLSDGEFARSWVEARRRSKKTGKLRLKQELFQKGINKEIIEEVINSYQDGDISIDEEQLAQQALEKKWRVWKLLSDLEKKRKGYEFLMRRGFEYEVVKSVIEKLIRKE